MQPNRNPNTIKRLDLRNKLRIRSTSTQTLEKLEDTIHKKIKKEKNQPVRRNVKIWEPDEDNLLRTNYYKFNGNWHEIIKHVPGRNMNQCSQRWRRINPIEVLN